MSDAPALIVAAVVLVPIAGLFAAVDSALNTVSRARVEDMVKDGRPGAIGLLTIVADRPRYVNLTVLLRILCEIVATVLLAGGLIGVLDETIALLVTAVVMVLVSYIVIGVGPRTLGRQHAYSIALFAALPLRGLGWILGPVSRVLIFIGNAITPGRGFHNGPFASEIELRELVDMARERGVVADDERRMIQSVFELGDTSAREVMVPRPEMVWIESDKSAGQATSLAVRSGHSRIPVIGENVDDIIGVVYLKDLVQQTYYSTDGGRGVKVTDVMRPAVFVPDSKPLDSLLAEMQRDRKHMAVLIDEYGGTAGLVTIEDVLEEIVGEIADEYDAGEVAPIEDLGDGRYRVSARVPLDDVGELFDIDIESEDVDTVGGLLGYELGRVPLPGSRVQSHGLAFTGEGGADQKGRVRVTTVLVERFENDHDEESSTEASDA
ncbi:HlyC/CorC family transporter [Rhodococcus sp. PAMC28707]|uniref:hemolysin family protein n=1 Tax=unclassified Rhodococcus (in: high G+C Gram-positive bacteria) TaxID=192944 RepID=UPI00109E1F39|nr:MULTISPECIES: hemolysin family protein [unclassified Rhodococcus (in: high G+C Gram-positive bacteria)]QCB51635.1 HlyC/CorC family transporter [Rhodococcus sp. PAMC28705]QCB60198.1 HlyC/CorC family transporter [Rhodococcus sp. PAMC28707]